MQRTIFSRYIVPFTYQTSFRSFSSTSSTANIKTIGVVGAGQMGQGIGYVASVIAKKRVIFLDASEKSLSSAQTFLNGLFNKDVSKGKLTEQDSKSAAQRLSYTTNYDDLKQVDFVIEAATENVELKKKIFTQLARKLLMRILYNTFVCLFAGLFVCLFVLFLYTSLILIIFL